ncbi:uncharacterized protein LOC133898348 isoform X2 [Phragmites australis]|uniref:uncharacterized protein LOC133898348 isoform X2 n=1 Tax=Phragmites australis TaxID=29695 RepID=UPI002D78B014|nr:uncharacterized protein LOC133898348 isoform X2 [Phragmites australis]
MACPICGSSYSSSSSRTQGYTTTVAPSNYHSSYSTLSSRTQGHRTTTAMATCNDEDSSLSRVTAVSRYSYDPSSSWSLYRAQGQTTTAMACPICGSSYSSSSSRTQGYTTTVAPSYNQSNISLSSRIQGGSAATKASGNYSSSSSKTKGNTIVTNYSNNSLSSRTQRHRAMPNKICNSSSSGTQAYVISSASTIVRPEAQYSSTNWHAQQQRQFSKLQRPWPQTQWQANLDIWRLRLNQVMPPKRHAPATPDGDGQAQLVAAMRAMKDELRTLRQATSAAGAPTGAASGAARIVDGPVSGVSLMQWVGMKLDSFDGSGTPVHAADWLSYVEDKMEAFDVLAHDRVRYGVQLLKGEAQIWWKGVQSARTAAHGQLSWHEFVRQFERRFYPVTFLDRMKIDLNAYTQDKKSVAEYEVGFNQIVRFVPHVAHDEWNRLWVWRCSRCTLLTCRSLQVVSTCPCRSTLCT